MKTVEIDNLKYEIIENYKDAFDEEEFMEKCTDYFYPYDYILGDIAYGKLRLKGFYSPNNKKVNQINNFKNKDSYLKDYCACDCKYFIVKKISE